MLKMTIFLHFALLSLRMLKKISIKSFCTIYHKFEATKSICQCIMIEDTGLIVYQGVLPTSLPTL